MASKNNNNGVMEELTKLRNNQRLISDNTMNELKKILCELYHCDFNNNPILINGELPNLSRIGQLEEVVNRIEERLDGSRSRYSSHNNRRGVVARRGGRRTRRRRRKKSTRRRRKKRRRKGGGPRKNTKPEEPIVGYNYLINIYWPVGGTGPFTELRYENVEGEYMGLASEIFDGWADDERIPIPPYVFKTNLLDCEEGCIGKIVRLIGGTDNINVNINGGRRKKRTRRRGKSRRR